MSKNKNHIDLTTGFYDTLEHRLGALLGLKVMLVRGWDKPATCEYSRDGSGNETFGSDDPYVQDLTRQYRNWLVATGEYERRGRKGKSPGPDPLREEQKDTLLAYLYDRDPQLVDTMYEEEALSLLERGHVTLRDSAAQPATAVIVHDLRQNVRDQSRLIEHIFGATFPNGFAAPGDSRTPRHIPFINFVENFDIGLEDYRAHKALSDIRYALSHQFEQDAHGKDAKNQPYYYRFAGIADKNGGIDKPAAKMSFAEATRRFGSRALYDTRAGIADARLAEKLMNAQAVLNLLYADGGKPPVDSFARLYHIHGGGIFAALDGARIAGYASTLRDGMENAIAAHLPDGYGRMMAAGFARDPRVAIPVFRELRGRLAFDEPGRAWLDSIWRGIESYFPTLAAAPVPALAGMKEPPRSAAGYRMQSVMRRPPAAPQP